MKGYRGHVAVDLDDVVLDLVGGVTGVVAREYGVEVPEITDWNMNLVLQPILGRPWMKFMRERDWLWSSFPAIDGAIGGVDTLRRRGFYVECVTSKPDWAEAQVWKWLGLWRPAFHRVTITGPEDRKVDMTEASLLIDDKPENCEGFLQEGRRAILFTRPHNARNRQIHVAGAVRMESWRAIVDALDIDGPLWSTKS